MREVLCSSMDVLGVVILYDDGEVRNENQGPWPSLPHESKRDCTRQMCRCMHMSRLKALRTSKNVHNCTASACLNSDSG